MKSAFVCTIFIQCFLASYYFMFVSISTSDWTSDDVNHEGLWKECSYGTNRSRSIGNETSFFKGTCCASKQFKVYSGTTGVVFVIIITIDVILILVLCLFKCNGKLWVIYSVASSVCMVVVLSVYVAEDSMNLGWSYFLAFGSFIFRTLTYFGVYCLLHHASGYSLSSINLAFYELIKSVRSCK